MVEKEKDERKGEMIKKEKRGEHFLKMQLYKLVTIIESKSK